MPWAIREATIASAVVVLSIRGALVFRFAGNLQIGPALSRGGVFPFRRGSANTHAQFLACHAPRKRGIQYPKPLPFRCRISAASPVVTGSSAFADDDNAFIAPASRAPIETGGPRPEDLDASLSY